MKLVVLKVKSWVDFIFSVDLAKPLDSWVRCAFGNSLWRCLDIKLKMVIPAVKHRCISHFSLGSVLPFLPLQIFQSYLHGKEWPTDQLASHAFTLVEFYSCHTSASTESKVIKALVPLVFHTQHCLGPVTHHLDLSTIRDGSTWSKFGARGEHGDVFLFSKKSKFTFVDV